MKVYSNTIYPRGRIILDSENASTLELDDISSLLGADPESSFSLTSERVSKLTPNKVYYRYQQFHQGIHVDNGGYTILAAPPGAVGGCDQAGLYAISPAIATGINVNTTTAISQEEAAASIGNNLVTNTSELSIVWGLTEENTYHLTYKVDYVEDDKPYRAWIDAHNSSILKKAELNAHLLAPTSHYCEQNLDDSPTSNGGRILQTQDGVLRTYDFPNNSNTGIEDFLIELIPTTNTGQWNDPSVRNDVYQSHFCASNIIPEFNGLINGIDEFTNVNIAVKQNFENAVAFGQSQMNDAYLIIGWIGSETFGLNDVIGHELTHVFIGEYINNIGAEGGTRSLNEGVCDMFGTYLESLIQNNEDIECTPDGLDWIMGDDVQTIAEFVNRDLENPLITTWEEAQEITNIDINKRSTLISHWFYLISEGSNGIGGYYIPELGIERAINIVLETLLNLNNRNADFPDFMEAVEQVVDMNWGRCSEESVSIRNAFRRIGLSNGEYCAYVDIKHKYCEENDGLLLCVTGGFEDDHYRWYFPDGWTVPGSGNTNILNDSRCLRVTDLPDYDYYPQNLTVRLYDVTNNNDLRYTIRLEDCNGDDPTCHEVELNTIPLSQTAEERGKNSSNQKLYSLLRVFDITGRKVYEGQNFDKSFTLSNSNRLLIYCYYDLQGNIIETKKQ